MTERSMLKSIRFSRSIHALKRTYDASTQTSSCGVNNHFQGINHDYSLRQHSCVGYQVWRLSSNGRSTSTSRDAAVAATIGHFTVCIKPSLKFHAYHSSSIKLLPNTDTFHDDRFLGVALPKGMVSNVDQSETSLPSKSPINTVLLHRPLRLAALACYKLVELVLPWLCFTAITQGEICATGIEAMRAPYLNKKVVRPYNNFPRQSWCHFHLKYASSRKSMFLFNGASTYSSSYSGANHALLLDTTQQHCHLLNADS
ncbi:hypothetical protein AC578_6307 [Pseudocercospora eumusae]|uniref:Uncharacterized protein n=1 Tax=Pseudocercospora eumusae TaxID=321146 RepID=A0A139H226_9PEZI|nr:hypothetical protein AC578_6307 [Pseudocercospora eumusae]